MMTRRRYLDDEYLDSCEAEVVAVDNGWLSLSDTIAYPGGGGQPADRVTVEVVGEVHHVGDMRVDKSGAVWVLVSVDIPVGAAVTCRIDWPFRYALMRHHALMHIVNTVARRGYHGQQTGTQLGPKRSRIDFRFPEFDRAWLPKLEGSVNEVIERDLPISTAVITEDEFRARPELIRTKNVTPPIEDGRIRIVEIEGFEAQACGGTHVRSTGEIGTARVDRYDNKGRENKRIYWVLGDERS
jgi:misacylated tRNA(Ala) deacylase